MSPRFRGPAVQHWPAGGAARNGKGVDLLLENLVFDTSWGQTVTVPKGFTSDGGSVPWWGRWLVNPSNNQRAWWVHDWAWDNHWHNHARLLDEALIADDCPLFHRIVVVLAVTIAGKLRST